MLDFDPASTAGALLYGWSGFETTPEGASFVWATGLEAGVVFECSAPRLMTLRVALWPFEVPGQAQRVRGFVNQHLLGEVTLTSGRQSLEVPVPAPALQEGRNLLLFQFASAVAPAEFREGSRDWRPLACAYDRIELVFD